MSKAIVEVPPQLLPGWGEIGTDRDLRQGPRFLQMQILNVLLRLRRDFILEELASPRVR